MEKDNNRLDLRRLWRSAWQCRWIYLGMIILCLGIGIWRAIVSMPKHTIVGDVLIGEIGYDDTNAAGGMAQMMKTFSVGGFGGAAVDNEMEIMKSHDVMVRTVRMLGLNRSYLGKKDNGKKAVLYQNSPVAVEAPTEYFDTLSVPFKINIELLGNGSAHIKATKGFFGTTIAEVDNARLPMMFDTPLGSLHIMPTEHFESSPYRDITVSVYGNDLRASLLYQDTKIDVKSKLADIIEIEYDCTNADLGMVTVDGIMGEYNSKRLEHMHEAAIASIQYYDDRIAEAFKDLQKIEREVSDYQRANELMGIDTELGLLVGTAVGNKPAIMTANYNIAYHETILDILRTRLNDDVIIPQMESLNDPHIAAFNGAIQARRDLKRSATDDNTALQLLNQKIQDLRDIIIENSEKMIAKSKADVKHQQELTNVVQKRLDAYPDYQLEFMNLLRDKEYKNSLYQYLVSSRENSVLQLYSKTNLGFVYQPAYVYSSSGIFKRLLWPVAMLIFALFASSCIALFLMFISRKVKDPMDIAFMEIDANAVNYAGDREQINRLRTLITADTSRRLIYSADFAGNGIATKALTDSLLSIERSVEIISGLADNDTILTPSFNGRVKEALAATDYVIVDIPAPTRLFELEHIIDNNNANLLIALESGKIKRSTLKKYLSGQTAARVYTLIEK